MKTMLAMLALVAVCAAQMPFLSNVFGSNMVLQGAPYQATLWGWIQSPSDTVMVNLTLPGYQSFTFPTDIVDGSWNVTFPPIPAATAWQEPDVFTITISSPSATVTLENIVFGEVYLCGGQSNMQFTVPQGFNASEEIEAADNYPNIRLFTVGQGTTSFKPLPILASIEQEWSVASSASVGGGNWTDFSAVCWFYGRDLYNTLGTPIGLISNNWGGTVVEAWTPDWALPNCPNNNTDEEAAQRVSAAFPEAMPGMPGPNNNTVLYNAMINPFTGMAVRGAIWYQGESNVEYPASPGAPYYACGFPNMITAWRKAFMQTPLEFSFFFVMLAAYTEVTYANDHLGLLRISQMAALELPNTGMASATDLGDYTSPFGNIHPRNKQTVGARLALTARALSYGEDVCFLGPMVTGATVDSTDFSVTVTFDTFNCGPLDAQPIPVCPAGLPSWECITWQLISPSGVYSNFTSYVPSPTNPNAVVLVANPPLTEAPAELRYLVGNWVQPVVFAGGLPAPPFIMGL